MRDRGFSLLELLVVISIVAIIAGMLLPVVSVVREAARGAQCGSNLRQICIAAYAYTNDWDGVLCPVYYPGVDGAALGKTNWTGLLESYLGGPCLPGSFVRPERDLRVATCPVSPHRFGYGLNYTGCASTVWHPLPLSQIINGSNLVYFVDNVMTDAGLAWLPAVNRSPDDMMAYRAWVRPPFVVPNPETIVNFAHRQRSNVAWVDGHVSMRVANDGFVTGASGYLAYWDH